ncbi:MAG: hypothetical protein ACR2MP_31600 [Streptosporangiaceae bacterium]
MSTPRAGHTEDLIQIIILLAIGGMAGAASFTHVHDWTMNNVPPGTGGWFGWANAVISELTPTAAGLEIRRRKRHHRPIAYPMTVLVAAAALSLTAQVAQAAPSPTGWLVAAIPALAFLALSKLVLSRALAQQPAAPADTPSDELPIPVGPIPAADAATADPLPTELLTGARMAAFTHRQATGHDITADTLASHLAIPPALAGRVLHALDGTATIQGISSSAVTHVNGTSYPAGSRL